MIVLKNYNNVNLVFRNCVKYCALFLFSLCFLSACSSKIKKKIGMSAIGPNESLVQKYEALEVPPHYYLQDIDGKTTESLNGANDANNKNVSNNSSLKKKHSNKKSNAPYQ